MICFARPRTPRRATARSSCSSCYPKQRRTGKLHACRRIPHVGTKHAHVLVDRYGADRVLAQPRWLSSARRVAIRAAGCAAGATGGLSPQWPGESQPSSLNSLDFSSFPSQPHVVRQFCATPPQLRRCMCFHNPKPNPAAPCAGGAGDPGFWGELPRQCGIARSLRASPAANPVGDAKRSPVRGGPPPCFSRTVARIAIAAAVAVALLLPAQPSIAVAKKRPKADASAAFSGVPRARHADGAIVKRGDTGRLVKRVQRQLGLEGRRGLRHADRARGGCLPGARGAAPQRPGRPQHLARALPQAGRVRRERRDRPVRRRPAGRARDARSARAAPRRPPAGVLDDAHRAAARHEDERLRRRAQPRRHRHRGARRHGREGRRVRDRQRRRAPGQRLRHDDLHPPQHGVRHVLRPPLLDGGVEGRGRRRRGRPSAASG